MTPQVVFSGHLEVSVLVKEADSLPKEVQIHLESSTSNWKSMYVLINKDSKVSVHVNDTLVDGNLSLAAHTCTPTHPPAHAWITLVITLHRGRLLIYRPEDRLRVLTAEVPQTDGAINAYVTSSVINHVAFNCASGCLIHDEASPLMGHNLKLESEMVYVSLEGRGDDKPPKMLLASFNSKQEDDTPEKNLEVDFSDAKTDHWYKVLLQAQNSTRAADSEEVVTVRGVPVKNVSYTVSNATGVLWTYQCYPNMTRERWVEAREMTTTAHTPTDSSKDQSGGAQAGQVIAWVFTGLALFLVMVLALALCAKMTPPPARTHSDFRPSVDIVSQRYGVSSVSHREAEEESEPGSPVLTVSRTLHPDDHYSTKVL
ncbi:uncharacterized protein [Cherax quadricarinatus]